jgi:two-component system phosphate regulon sensor histidine kinase PhoR
MLALVVTGLVFGLGAAAREIAMSQRQIELVGRVSHELRTPLTSIGMFVEALREGRLDAERQAECLDLLSRETERLSRRIEEVLAWARMESGARRYHTTTVSVADVVQRAMDALRTAAMFEEAEGLDVTVDLPAQLPDLEVDPDAVVEALLNLLVNAWRHTEPPRVVRVTATARPRRVGISVSDNGPGISSRDRRRIFEKFYQPESDETRYGATRGTGLGLAIVRAIVRAHGGRVDLAPARDRGSTFTIWLPVAG